MTLCHRRRRRTGTEPAWKVKVLWLFVAVLIINNLGLLWKGFHLEDVAEGVQTESGGRICTAYPGAVYCCSGRPLQVERTSGTPPEYLNASVYWNCTRVTVYEVRP